MKVIKVSAKAQAEFPDKAEIIQFKDELGLVSDHVKLNGKLYRPAVCWYEYKGSDGSDFTRKKSGDKSKSIGITLQMVDDDSPQEFFTRPEYEEWFLEEE